MRELKAVNITQAVVELVRRANFLLRKDVLLALRKAYGREKNRPAKKILKAILDNAAYAQKENLAICQDTGMPVVFVKAGQGEGREETGRGRIHVGQRPAQTQCFGAQASRHTISLSGAERAVDCRERALHVTKIPQNLCD